MKINANGKNKKGVAIDGWVINKPVGIGSTPVVSKVKKSLNAQKVGHAGTLDRLLAVFYLLLGAWY